MIDDEWAQFVAGAALPAVLKPKKRTAAVGVRPGHPNFYDPTTRRWHERKKL